MTETFISAGRDGVAVAAALADRLMGAGVTLEGCPEVARDNETVFARIARAERVVLLVTPGWLAECWPRIALYLARALRSPAAFLAKLALIDLSDGTAVPAALRPLLGGGIRVAPSRALAASALHAMAALATALRDVSSAGANVSRPIVVVGHPGSGKSTFCALLEARLNERGIGAATIDPYPFLQALFRIDRLRQDRTRFESDRLSEFLITDPSVLDESIMLTKARLSREIAAGRPAIVELAFTDGPAIDDLVASRPDGIVVHVAASLKACKRNNEARGAIVQQRLDEEGQPGAAFDRLPSLHYVPPSFYARYELDPPRWEEGATRLAALVGARCHRLENDGRDLVAYRKACDVFVTGTLWPLLDLQPV